MITEDRKQVEERFYSQVAEILETPHDYKFFTMHRKKRWFKRMPGNGRYIGKGLVRMFSPNAIHISIHTPIKINKMCKSVDEALEILNENMGLHRSSQEIR